LPYLSKNQIKKVLNIKYFNLIQKPFWNNSYWRK